MKKDTELTLGQDIIYRLLIFALIVIIMGVTLAISNAETSKNLNKLEAEIETQDINTLD